MSSSSFSTTASPTSSSTRSPTASPTPASFRDTVKPARLTGTSIADVLGDLHAANPVIYALCRPSAAAVAATATSRRMLNDGTANLEPGNPVKSNSTTSAPSATASPACLPRFDADLIACQASECPGAVADLQAAIMVFRTTSTAAQATSVLVAAEQLHVCARTQCTDQYLAAHSLSCVDLDSPALRTANISLTTLPPIVGNGALLGGALPDADASLAADFTKYQARLASGETPPNDAARRVGVCLLTSPAGTACEPARMAPGDSGELSTAAVPAGIPADFASLELGGTAVAKVARFPMSFELAAPQNYYFPGGTCRNGRVVTAGVARVPGASCVSTGDCLFGTCVDGSCALQPPKSIVSADALAQSFGTLRGRASDGNLDSTLSQVILIPTIVMAAALVALIAKRRWEMHKARKATDDPAHATDPVRRAWWRPHDRRKYGKGVKRFGTLGGFAIAPPRDACAVPVEGGNGDEDDEDDEDWVWEDEIVVPTGNSTADVAAAAAGMLEPLDADEEGLPEYERVLFTRRLSVATMGHVDLRAVRDAPDAAGVAENVPESDATLVPPVAAPAVPSLAPDPPTLTPPAPAATVAPTAATMAAAAATPPPEYDVHEDHAQVAVGLPPGSTGGAQHLTAFPAIPGSGLYLGPHGSVLSLALARSGANSGVSSAAASLRGFTPRSGSLEMAPLVSASRRSSASSVGRGGGEGRG
ncbi:hypothetical protein GGF31_004816 [Allomyces arbusculus]|nr:hypothetical protein GGF31_004816 [Allomyces arbusculus]